MVIMDFVAFFVRNYIIFLFFMFVTMYNYRHNHKKNIIMDTTHIFFCALPWRQEVFRDPFSFILLKPVE